MPFNTAFAAHEAFYQALETADIALMSRVWGDADNTVCIHPLWPALIGRQEIITSWAEMFNHGSEMQVDTQLISQQETPQHCTHLVQETLSAFGRSSSPVLATNGYQRTGEGWVMVLHHASPTAQEPADGHEEYPLH